MTGIVIKPLTGTLDAASKLAEGVKNTVTHFEDKPNSERDRNPRPFYTQNK